VDNIKLDLVEIEWDGMNWTDLAEGRYKWRGLVNAGMNLRVLQNTGKLSSGYATGGLSSIAHLHNVSQLIVIWLCA
jgi:hypothetical protein